MIETITDQYWRRYKSVRLSPRGWESVHLKAVLMPEIKVFLFIYLVDFVNYSQQLPVVLR